MVIVLDTASSIIMIPLLLVLKKSINPFMKVNSILGKNRVKANKCGKIAQYMKVSGTIITCMAMAFISGQTIQNMRVNL